MYEVILNIIKSQKYYIPTVKQIDYLVRGKDLKK